MKIAYEIAFGIHLLSIVGILALLLTQPKKNPRKLSAGVPHATLTALVAALVMVGLFTEVNPDEVLNHTKIGVKTLVITTLLFLGYKNVKKPVLSTKVWQAMIGLTLLNVFIAYLWH